MSREGKKKGWGTGARVCKKWWVRQVKKNRGRLTPIGQKKGALPRRERGGDTTEPLLEASEILCEKKSKKTIPWLPRERSWDRKRKPTFGPRKGGPP